MNDVWQQHPQVVTPRKFCGVDQFNPVITLEIVIDSLVLLGKTKRAAGSKVLPLCLQPQAVTPTSAGHKPFHSSIGIRFPDCLQLTASSVSTESAA
jgi:hypothetical protein